jgi:hypothetical protein
MESVARAVDVGSPKKHRVSRCPVVTSRNASACTGTTLIAGHARDATATGSAPTARTTASNAAQVLARDAKPISESGASARPNTLVFPKMTFGTCQCRNESVTYIPMEPRNSKAHDTRPLN